jgi:Fe-S oxidoreductase
MLTQARQLVRRQVARLAALTSDGTPILGLEPSCLLSLVDEWLDLLPGAETAAAARSAFLLEHWLENQVDDGRLKLPFQERNEPAVLHAHCHQRALVGVEPSARLARRVPGYHLELLDTGCCGMAGLFGYEASHYDLSVRIAELSLLPALAERPQAKVLATGTSCRRQILDLANRRAYHPIEWLADALPASPSEVAPSSTNSPPTS